jgi:hypothetical protein
MQKMQVDKLHPCLGERSMTAHADQFLLPGPRLGCSKVRPLAVITPEHVSLVPLSVGGAVITAQSAAHTEFASRNR